MLPECLAGELRDGRVLSLRSGVQRGPEIVLEIELRAPHDVYYTSLSGRYSTAMVAAGDRTPPIEIATGTALPGVTDAGTTAFTWYRPAY